MKIAVYNRYWVTLGGGEKYSGMLAQCLSEDHEVHILAHDEIEVPMMEERLGLDLSRVKTLVVEDDTPRGLVDATAGYDLLINSSFTSDAPSGAKKGIYVVYFPVPYEREPTGMQKLAKRTIGPLVASPNAKLEWGPGWFLPEKGRLRRYRWGADEAYLRFHVREGESAEVTLSLGALRPEGAPPAKVKIAVDGSTVRELSLVRDDRHEVRLKLEGRVRGDPRVVCIKSSTFSPKELFGTHDSRRLGVALLGVKIGERPLAFLASSFDVFSMPPVSLEFLRSYDRIVSISEYSKKWVQKLWGIESEILYPPVSPQPSGDKEPVILSVGRFFDRSGGHSKKQLEMVKTFRSLVRRGLRGWTYHIVGGYHPSDVAYLDKVKAEAQGLPIEIHVEATGADLKNLYSRASIFWHATGLGEDESRFPDRFEHFGITTVEAMSAGVVPIVIGKAGQLEVLEDGVHGRHFQTLEELGDLTWELVHDEEKRSAMAGAARAHAVKFSPEHFAERSNEIVGSVLQSR